eukprot:6210918-Pleurochrysis_carterae.AAC.1
MIVSHVLLFQTYLAPAAIGSAAASSALDGCYFCSASDSRTGEVTRLMIAMPAAGKHEFATQQPASAPRCAGRNLACTQAKLIYTPTIHFILTLSSYIKCTVFLTSDEQPGYKYRVAMSADASSSCDEERAIN